MPKTIPKVTIEPYQAEITAWYAEGVSQIEICNRLRDQHDLVINERSLRRYFSKWGVKRTYGSSEEVKAKVIDLFRHTLKTDREIAQLLVDDGFGEVKTATVANLRRDSGLYKKMKSGRLTNIDRQIKEVLQKEMSAGHIESYKREPLYKYLRSKYGLVGRDRIHEIARSINPDIPHRKPKAKVTRKIASKKEVVENLDPELT